MIKRSHAIANQPIALLDSPLRELRSQTIRIDSEAVALDRWAPMVEATQTDYLERGLIIAKSAGRILTSKVYGGDQHGFTPPPLAFGLRSLFSASLKERVVVHTHAMPPKVDHLKTTVISDEDIRAFTMSQYNGLVMLDRGGAHLLARTTAFRENDKLADCDIVSRTVQEVVGESGGTMDVMNRVAAQLHPYGLGYYYVSTLIPVSDQETNSIELYNLRLD
jgi:hypothetical protein